MSAAVVRASPSDLAMSTQNHFQHFGLPETFELDLQALGKAYRQAQQATHPDRFAHESAGAQRQAVQATALNTERYHTLKSPVTRGSYLLQLLGIDFDLSRYTVSDMDMLIDQMKYREQLSDIKEQSDFESLVDFQEKLEDKRSSVQHVIADLFNADPIANAEKIKAQLCELQFFDKLHLECEQVEEHLLDD